MWQLQLAPQKCCICRFQNPKWQIPRNYSFPTYKLSVDCGTLQLVLEVFLTGLYLDIMQKRNNVMLNCMSVPLADIGKIHFSGGGGGG